MSEALIRMLEYHRAARHYPGALVHVECDGLVCEKHCFGTLHGEAPGESPGAPMREDALFRIASLTKPIVSLLALMLVDEGRLSLDDPLGRLLPEIGAMRLSDGSAPRRAPTIRDLMRHTAGMPYIGETREPAALERARAAAIDGRLPLMHPDAFLRALSGLPLAHEPGAAFRYGYASDVLGLAIERVLGTRLGDALAVRIFEPLGMRDTRFGVEARDTDRMAGAFASDAAWHAFFDTFVRASAVGTPMQSGGGGLASTLADYVRFARMLAHGGMHDGRRLISAELFAEMTRNQLPAGVDGPFGFTGPGFGFGLGVAVREAWGVAAYPCARGEFTWSGASGTLMFVDPARRWFALLFSCNHASRMMTRFEFRRALAQT